MAVGFNLEASSKISGVTSFFTNFFLSPWTIFRALRSLKKTNKEALSYVSIVYFSPYFLIFRFGEMELPLENLLQQWKEPQRFTILHEETSNLEEDECSRKQPKEPKAVKQPTVVRSPILKVCVLLSLKHCIWFWNEHHCYATSCPWLAICNLNKHLHYAALSQ